MNAALSAKDEQFLEESLNAPMWRVVLKVGTPLALYMALQQLFLILDTMMASHISAKSVSAVAYLSQLNIILSAFGTGLAVGSGILISRAYGEGNMVLVKKRISTLYAISLLAGIAIAAIILPMTGTFLRIAGTPAELIREGSAYFAVQLFVIVITFLNNVYIAVERARGNSTRIFYLNILVIAVKLSLTAFFVYVLEGTLVMIAYASLASQLVLLLFAIKNNTSRDSAFGFSPVAISFKKEILLPMFSKSFPVMLEKTLFAFGKTVINSMAAGYGALMVGALGVSNNLGGITTSPQNGFQDGTAAVIAQNDGAQKPGRVVQAFYSLLIIVVVLSGLISGTKLLLLHPLSSLFSAGDRAFQEMIMSVYRWEAAAAVPLGVNAAVMALLYGLGKTRLTLVINVSRVFLFRIPIFYYLRNFTDLGDISCGIVMFMSNALTALLAVVIGIIVIRKYRRKHGI